MSNSGNSERKCVVLVVTVSQALGVSINYPVVVAVAVHLWLFGSYAGLQHMPSALSPTALQLG